MTDYLIDTAQEVARENERLITENGQLTRRAERTEAAAEALAADAETLLNHREQGNLHSVDYQRLAQTLRQYREATK